MESLITCLVSGTRWLEGSKALVYTNLRLISQQYPQIQGDFRQIHRRQLNGISLEICPFTVTNMYRSTLIFKSKSLKSNKSDAIA